jgi:hypothetical protein
MRRTGNVKGTHALACVLTLTLTAACGLGGEETPPLKTPLPPAASSSADKAAGAPRPGDWQTWTPAQKEAWMKAGVMPKMHALFASVDASKYGEMATQVEPTMASLLAVQPHDMKTNTGFSCFNCHTKE